MIASGTLAGDIVWSGDVLLAGDVVVPEGVTLRVLPGTRISCAERPRWSCAVFRSAPEGWPIEASEREACDLVVLGSLVMEGATVAGAPWGGLTLMASARARLTDCSFEARAPFSVQTFDDSRAEIVACRFSNCDIGVWSFGLSTVRVRGGLVAAARLGILACEGARVALDGVSVQGGERAVCGEGWAVLSARGCRFEGQRDGAALAKDEGYVVAR